MNLLVNAELIWMCIGERLQKCETSVSPGWANGDDTKNPLQGQGLFLSH